MIDSPCPHPLQGAHLKPRGIAEELLEFLRPPPQGKIPQRVIFTRAQAGFNLLRAQIPAAHGAERVVDDGNHRGKRERGDLRIVEGRNVLRPYEVFP